MWRPIISHPNVHYSPAGFDLQHDAERMVLATPEESNNEWHMDERGVVRPGGVPSTSEEAAGLPLAEQWDNFFRTSHS